MPDLDNLVDEVARLTGDNLVDEVARLTEATTELLDTTNVSKQSLDTAVSTSTEAASRAVAAEQKATPAASQAVAAKVAAEAARDAAAAIVYEGDATVEPAPGKLAIADDNGTFKAGWMPPYIKDSYRHAVESATGGRNTVLYDIHGNANVMVVFPKFTYDELQMTDTMGTGVCTAFLKGGNEVSEVFVAKYLASGNQAVSMPAVDPRTSINFDSAKSACQAKGGGWHLMSMHEWAALSLWCMANGYQPRGNTEYGRAHDMKWEFGERGDSRAPNDRSGSARTDTGSGPATWAHDQTDAGVYDLVGNVWEWQDHLKIHNGQVICSLDNDDTLLEAQWTAQDCYFDNPLKLNSQVTSTASVNTEWKTLPKDPSYVSNELMKRLMIEPTGLEIQGRLYVNNDGERLPVRGGHWGSGSSAGLAALHLSGARSGVGSDIGFRPAFALDL